MRALMDRAGFKLALVIAAVAGALMMAAVIGFKGEARTSGRQASASTPKEVATAASRPKSRLECEEKFGKETNWHRCFSQTPGSSCAHPLEVQKAGATYRGDTRYFKVGFHEEPSETETQQYYSWTPKSGVAICPHGVIYRVSLFSNEEHCGRINGEEICGDEYDTKNIAVRSTAHGGTLEYPMSTEPPKSFYLVIRGYFVHPRSQHYR